METHLDRAVDELEISVRSAMILQGAGIAYIGELVQWRERDLVRLGPNSRKSVRELGDILRELGLSFGMELPEWRRPDGADVVRRPRIPA